MQLPNNISKKNYIYHWTYLNDNREPVAIVVRYEDPGEKKRFHQFRPDENGNWVEGAPTPTPLYGIETLPKNNYEGFLIICEGEKCTQALHSLTFPVLTSMMGAAQAATADWAILAAYRHIMKFILIPDNDVPGQAYMHAVYSEVKKACPHAIVVVCELPSSKKGDDVIDWIKAHPSCPQGWNEFDLIDEPHSNYLRNAILECISEHSMPAEDYFGKALTCPVQFDSDPLPIEGTLSPVMPCPIHTLPKEISEWADIVAQQMQTPVDFVAVSIIVCAGSVIGRKRAVELRPDSGWIEFPNLWGMLIGRPSSMKTPSMDAAMKPLIHLDQISSKAYNAVREAYDAQMEGWELKKKAVDGLRKKEYAAALKQKIDYIEEYTIEEPPQKPIQRRYKTDDSTTEKLGELLIENTQGIMLVRDELTGWLKSFEKPGRENDRQFYLESWSGKKDFNVDRIGRGSLYVPALFVSVFGGIQPGPLSRYVRSTIKSDENDDGLLQRFSMMVWPDLPRDWKLTKGLNVKIATEQVTKIFEHLNLLSFDFEGNPTILNFTPEGQSKFDLWQEKLELLLRGNTLSSCLETHFAKYKKLLPALCIIHEHLESDKNPTEIGIKALENSLEWITYLESHAKRVFGSASIAVPTAAKTLIHHIKSGDIVVPFTVRDVYHGHHWSGLTDSNEVQEVLNYLEEKGYLRCQRVGTGGRSTMKYWAHLKIFEN